MSTQQRGICRRCKKPNDYAHSRCIFCNERLAWADAGADENGEACPLCGRFNPYQNRECANCHAPLPWKDSPAARFVETHQPEREQKSLLLTIILSTLAVLIIVIRVLFLLWPRG